MVGGEETSPVKTVELMNLYRESEQNAVMAQQRRLS